ncbi:MAG TPA: hypothetical protein PK129_06120 [Cellvibrionaceae bacterium]|nr:hypothetical protein [Cellvibrionaceae bacterium]
MSKWAPRKRRSIFAPGQWLGSCEAPKTLSDAVPAAPAAREPSRPTLHRSLPLMIWIGALAVGLVAAAGFGIRLAFAYKRERGTVLGLLAAGIAIPIVLAFL